MAGVTEVNRYTIFVRKQVSWEKGESHSTLNIVSSAFRGVKMWEIFTQGCLMVTSFRGES